jgi:acetoin utilization deacetylase AcuC-like enzyme
VPTPLRIFTDRRMLLHDPGAQHPERPERLSAILELLERRPIAGAEQCQPEPVERAALELVHEPLYVASIMRQAGKSAVLDADTSVSPGSIDAARLAAGAAVDAMHSVCSGRSRTALAVVRPPGHHAEADRAMGFCLFNNIAVAAVVALQERALERVLIVDWDVHHGNGTAHSFESDDQVLVFNTHQWPLYPGTGAVSQVGKGRGQGFTVNVPLPPACTDTDYLAVFDRLLAPVARQYRPQLILVSAGFDAHKDDPLGNMRISTEGFGLLCGRVRALADELCEGRLVLVSEGGYHLQALAHSVHECARVMSGESPAKSLPSVATPDGQEALEVACQVQSQYWKL